MNLEKHADVYTVYLSDGIHCNHHRFTVSDFDVESFRQKALDVYNREKVNSIVDDAPYKSWKDCVAMAVMETPEVYNGIAQWLDEHPYSPDRSNNWWKDHETDKYFISGAFIDKDSNFTVDVNTYYDEEAGEDDFEQPAYYDDRGNPVSLW